VAHLTAEHETGGTADERTSRILDWYRDVAEAETEMADLREALVQSLSRDDRYFSSDTAQDVVTSAARLLTLAVQRHEIGQVLWHVVPLATVHTARDQLPDTPSRATIARNRSTIPTTKRTVDDGIPAATPGPHSPVPATPANTARLL
jgi:hypothetical protein